MTREAIEYFKFHRKIFCDDHLKICPKDSIAYQATLKEKEFYDMAIKALEQEPRKDEVILTKEEYGELVSSEFDNGYAKGYREALEQEPIEVEATKLQMAYNQGFEDCRKAVMDLLSEAGKLSLLAMVADLQSVNPQEPRYCDRNICIKNEYNGKSEKIDCNITKCENCVNHNCCDSEADDFLAEVRASAESEDKE